MLHKLVLFLLSLSIVSSVYAESAATVSIIQAPVWLERQGDRSPLELGDQLLDKDRIITGKGARVLLKLNDDSTVKLGEDVTFIIEELSPPEQEGGLLKGFLNVIKGAFRYTTGKLSNNYNRDLKVSVSTATIGIRGTDVWGKAETSRDFVVLLEGEISIERDNESVQMNEPLTLFMAPKGQAAEPIQPVNQDDLAIWAQETEPQQGKGIRVEDGLWKVVLASYEEQRFAESKRQKLQSKGLSARIEEANIDNKIWYRLLIDKLSTRTDAEYVLNELQSEFGFSSPWLVN